MCLRSEKLNVSMSSFFLKNCQDYVNSNLLFHAKKFFPIISLRRGEQEMGRCRKVNWRRFYYLKFSNYDESL